jgi:hypothetical protein
MFSVRTTRVFANVLRLLEPNFGRLWLYAERILALEDQRLGQGGRGAIGPCPPAMPDPNWRSENFDQ